MRNTRWLQSALICCALTVATAGATTLDEQRLADLLEATREEMKMPGPARPRSTSPMAKSSAPPPALPTGKPGTALDNDIPMPGGSTGKTFVAALTMLLVEDGTLSLDDPRLQMARRQAVVRKAAEPGSHPRPATSSRTAPASPTTPAPSATTSTPSGRAVRHGGIRFTPEELIGFALDKKPLNPARRRLPLHRCRLPGPRPPHRIRHRRARTTIY